MTSFKVPHKQTVTGIIYSCILTIGGITVDSKTKREFASGRDWVFSTHFQLLLLGIWLDAGCSYKEPWLWSWLLLEATRDHASPNGRSFSFWGGLKLWLPSPAVTFTNISTAACSPRYLANSFKQLSSSKSRFPAALWHRHSKPPCNSSLLFLPPLSQVKRSQDSAEYLLLSFSLKSRALLSLRVWFLRSQRFHDSHSKLFISFLLNTQSHASLLFVPLPPCILL